MAWKLKCTATQRAYAAATVATDATQRAYAWSRATDTTTTHTALDAAEKCVALLQTQLVEGMDDAEPPSAKRRRRSTVDLIPFDNTPTETIYTQGPYEMWAMTKVPCAPHEVVVTALPSVSAASLSHTRGKEASLSHTYFADFTSLSHTRGWVGIRRPDRIRSTLLPSLMESELQKKVLGFLRLRLCGRSNRFDGGVRGHDGHSP